MLMEHLLDCYEVADILHVSRSYVYALLRRGDIPCLRMGRAVRIRPGDLDHFMHTSPQFASRRSSRRANRKRAG